MSEKNSDIDWVGQLGERSANNTVNLMLTSVGSLTAQNENLVLVFKKKEEEIEQLKQELQKEREAKDMIQNELTTYKQT